MTLVVGTKIRGLNGVHEVVKTTKVTKGTLPWSHPKGPSKGLTTSLVYRWRLREEGGVFRTQIL